MAPNNQKVAIVCDWITGIGGAERVVLELHRLYPNAPIYTSQYDPAKIDWFKDADVRTTWLQKLPKNNTFKKFLPLLRRFTFESLNLTEYDIVISSSGAEAKSIKKLKNSAIHISYCHAPTHYYWSRYNEYLEEPGFGKLNFLARLGLKVLVKPMRNWDYKAAQRPDYLIANSEHIKSEIKKYYGRESVVINPPVNIERFQKTIGKFTKNNYIILGRQVPYKKVDLAVECFNKLNLPLAVVGTGPMHQKLINQANKNITFITNATDSEVPRLLAQAKWFIFPGVEDFGITPVEAIAAGTPVIAYKAGGALDYINKQSGIFFGAQTVESLTKAVVQSQIVNLSEKTVSAQANKFSDEHFKQKIQQFITEVTQK